jgi:hypothetical protein
MISSTVHVAQLTAVNLNRFSARTVRNAFFHRAPLELFSFDLIAFSNLLDFLGGGDEASGGRGKGTVGMVGMV